MLNVMRPAAFVLLSTNHGTLIVNRNDYRMVDEDKGYGVGYQLMNTSSFDQQEVDFALSLLELRKLHHGAGVVAIDCGANIGVHTVEWGRLMARWGSVYSFEAQEKIFYALAGNVAINNCFNVTARHCAVGARTGSMDIPEPDYLVPSTFGSLELRQGPNNEFIGQTIDYQKTRPVPLVSIDSLAHQRVDLIKIDVEGMEEDVLAGATATIRASRPILIVEAAKSDRAALESFMQSHGYKVFPMGLNVLAVHEKDPVSRRVSISNNALVLN